MNRKEAEKKALMEQVYLPMQEGRRDRGRQDRLKRDEDELARADDPYEEFDEEHNSIEQDRGFRHNEYMKGLREDDD